MTIYIIAVASGQHPDEIQRTLCEICGDPPDEIDHRLAIAVARALGPAAMLRAFMMPCSLEWSTTTILAALRQLLWPLGVWCNCRL